MSRVKTDCRSRLAEVTLEGLMTIKLEGPLVECFDLNPANEKFFQSANRRPGSCPTGPQKRKLGE